jgi:hypothetical protein
MTPEQIGAALGILSEVVPRSALALNMYIAELELERDSEATRADRAEQERDATVADNAALLQALLDVAEMRLSPPTLKAMAGKLKTEPHPGAALLEEHRKEIDKWAENVATLRAERDTERQLRMEAAEQHRRALEPLRKQRHVRARSW